MIPGHVRLYKRDACQPRQLTHAQPKNNPYNPFEYVQFVFISDLFTQADIDTELNYELYKKYSNNHLMALTPLNTDCGFWYRNNIDNSLSLNDNNLLRYYNYFDFETNGVPNDYKIIQETIISDIIDLVGSGKASLPQSLIK